MHLHSGLRGHASPQPCRQLVVSVSTEARSEKYGSKTHSYKKQGAKRTSKRWVSTYQENTVLLQKRSTSVCDCVCVVLCVCVCVQVFATYWVPKSSIYLQSEYLRLGFEVEVRIEFRFESGLSNPGWVIKKVLTKRELQGWFCAFCWKPISLCDTVGGICDSIEKKKKKR